MNWLCINVQLVHTVFRSSFWEVIDQEHPCGTAFLCYKLSTVPDVILVLYTVGTPFFFFFGIHMKEITFVPGNLSR